MASGTFRTSAGSTRGRPAYGSVRSGVVVALTVTSLLVRDRGWIMESLVTPQPNWMPTHEPDRIVPDVVRASSPRCLRAGLVAGRCRSGRDRGDGSSAIDGLSRARRAEREIKAGQVGTRQGRLDGWRAGAWRRRGRVLAWCLRGGGGPRRRGAGDLGRIPRARRGTPTRRSAARGWHWTGRFAVAEEALARSLPARQPRLRDARETSCSRSICSPAGPTTCGGGSRTEWTAPRTRPRSFASTG